MLTASRDGEKLVVTHSYPISRKIWAVLRLSMGWIFLWAFLDKTFALGYRTGRTTLQSGREVVDYFGPEAWLFGFGEGSPTREFLEVETKGWFEGLFSSFAGAAWADWLFMVGLLGIGVALMCGIGIRIAALSATVLLLLMYLASPPMAVSVGSNPFLDNNLVYAVVLIGLALVNAGDTWGLGKQWSHTKLVHRFPFLK
jgi:thiosulfate dehydrogenase [quinone] large subunit